ncbi:MAG: hypothetical protein K5660_00865 [Paludibacteraceae bacterium]|nr:hypothetical protein [Paludibacteraceae bacterium]
MRKCFSVFRGKGAGLYPEERKKNLCRPAGGRKGRRWVGERKGGALCGWYLHARDIDEGGRMGG